MTANSFGRPPLWDAALRKAISPDRIGTYTKAAVAIGCDELDLYLWDRDLASAVLADIAVVEVALRNAMHDALTRAYGSQEWYLRDIGLDDRSRTALAQAWTRLTKATRTPGRVVARLMFGFWVNLLDAGGHYGKEPQAFKADYEQLFRSTLSKAFPGGRTQAAQAGASFDRDWVHATVAVVRDLRNRAAHHEPLVDGFPLNGQKDKNGNPIRLSVQQGFERYLRLARMIDRDLGAWLGATSNVPAVIAARPTPPTQPPLPTG